MKNATNDLEWNAMFDVQRDLCKRVDELFQGRLEGLPAPVQTMAHLYVIEHLAERARFSDLGLPKLPWVLGVPDQTSEDQ